jgi:hypothetical protein
MPLLGQYIQDFFKKYASEEKMKNLDFPKCQDLTAKSCYVSKSLVLPICREAKKGTK